MANLGATFNTNEIPEDDYEAPEAFPANRYTLQVTESDLVEKDNGNMLLKVTYEVVGGEYEGRKMWGNFNLRHTSEQAQSIAQREFADLVLACGLTAVDDSEELHFIPFVADVKQEKRKDNGELANRIKKFIPAGGEPPASKPAPAKAATPAANTGSNGKSSRPWGNAAA